MPAVALLPASTFNDIRARTPDLGALEREYASVLDAVERAGGAPQALDAFFRWDALRRDFATWASLTELHFQQDTANPQYRAQNDALNELRPKMMALDVDVKRKFLQAAFRVELERELGSYLFSRWEMDVTAFDPAIDAETVREAQLCDAYVELLAGAEFHFHGERLNLSTIVKFREHPDAEVRRAAAQAQWTFFETNADRLDSLYGDLVAVRTAMARKLGYATFTELGYRRMLRCDYGPDDVARYREAIVEHIVPLAQRIANEQAAQLGTGGLMYWDESIFSLEPAPRPPQQYPEFLERARRAFDGIASDVGSFAQLMLQRGFVDLESRDRKAGGGFCTSFPTYGLPYIFANFNGTTHDVNVLLHEMGHAFQGYASREKSVSEYLWPTYEACEVHSMSMEFFGWPQLEQFFGSDAPRYRAQHLRSSIMFLPYGAAIDHFQHFVYDNPDATPAERNAFWKRLEATYMPWLRYGDIKRLNDGGRWQNQRHVYQMPFYYIDYTLAMCCALQFWAKSLDDYRGALEEYIGLCKRGGELPFQSLVRSAGLRSPFDAGVLRDVAARARAFLER